MWKPPLLKLNGVKEAIDLAKDAILNLLDEGTKLGMKDAVKLLDQTLAEEKKTDDALTKLADSEVNTIAQAA